MAYFKALSQFTIGPNKNYSPVAEASFLQSSVLETRMENCKR